MVMLKFAHLTQRLETDVVLLQQSSLHDNTYVVYKEKGKLQMIMNVGAHVCTLLAVQPERKV